MRERFLFPRKWLPPNMLSAFGKNLFAARARLGLTQKELATAIGAGQAHISQMESGQRIPSAEQWLRLADALHVSMQWFLTGSNRPGLELRDIAVQLQELGIRDLHVEGAVVPCAFMPPEQVVVAALGGDSPSPRIIEAMPTVLAWNAWDVPLLRAYSEQGGVRMLNRLQWLADVALTIHRNQGFPGGCPALMTLETLTVEGPQKALRPKNISAFPLSVEGYDSLGTKTNYRDVPPVARRWDIAYPGPLSVFHERAKHLHSLIVDRKWLTLEGMK